MLVKLKAEIITMKHPLIKPELGRAPSWSPGTQALARPGP
jgi:UPF0176 protein